MKKKYKWLLYGVYAVAVLSFFLYYLFPSETVKRYIIARISALNPEIRVSIRDIKPTLDPGLRLHAVHLGSGSQELMIAEEVDLKPDLMSLFSDSPSYRFFIKAFGGRIEGQAQVARQKTHERIEMDAAIVDIRLEMAPVVQQHTGNRLKGICSGTIRYRKVSGQDRTLNVQLTVADVSVGLKEPVFGIETLAFDSAEVEASLRSHSLKVDRLVVQGDQFDGNFSGSGVIRENLNGSSINLSGKITPQAGFMQGAGLNIAQALSGGIAGGDGQIPVRVTGPLGSVRLEFK